MAGRKPLPPTYFNLSILLIFASHFLIRFIILVSFPYNIIGVLPFLAGIYLNLAADKDFKIADTTVKPFEKSKVLLKTGVFSITRNPMYLGMFLILIGVSILLGSLIPFIVSIVYAVLMDKIFIGAEESMLEDTFADEWIEYKKKVRRWI
ncbi:methyltransferase family protein [Bacteroidota bacterium]